MLSFLCMCILLLFSHSVVSESLWPHRLQHARLPCPSPSPRVCPNSCPLSRWCHPIISSFVIPFSPCLHSFPASGSFPVSWLFTSGSQSIGASATASVLPMNIQGWFPLRLTSLISFLSKGCSSLLQDHSSKASVLPMNIQDWFPLGLTDLISFQFKGLSRVFFNTTVQKCQFFNAQPSLWYNSHIYTCLLEKP